MSVIHIVTIIGARPQFIKAAALSREIQHNFSHCIRETIVHTGQHYDFNMSDIFLQELDLPNPGYFLNIGQGLQGEQTAAMINEIEQVLLKEQPDICVVYGDTNSTLAGATAAAKLNIPVAHIEAGMRSFDKTMPEEQNRIACDHVSSFLFAPTATALRNLEHEGFRADTVPPYSVNNPAIVLSGDVMFDSILHYRDKAKKRTEIIQSLGLASTRYALCTIHRAHNTDQPQRLMNIFSAIHELSQETGLLYVIPLHPRTRKMIETNDSQFFSRLLSNADKMKIIDPVSYLEMIALESESEIILTDSGGVQKEAYFLHKPCVIFRKETEWPEIIEHNAGKLADDNISLIKESVQYFLNHPPGHFPEVFGNGHSAELICSVLADML
jgi:UDP-GlcNAc3NAcA epimerase